MYSDHRPTTYSTEFKPHRTRFTTMRAVMALILREISTTYGRSPGGYVWAVLEPAADIALLTAIFSIGFRHPPLGTNFSFFYAGGMLPFLMFVDISGKIGQTIQFSRTLLNYPRVTFVDAILDRLISNSLTHSQCTWSFWGLFCWYMPLTRRSTCPR